MTPVNPLERLGQPDACLSESERGIWLEIATLATPGRFERSDRWSVEVVCRLLFHFRRDGKLDRLGKKTLKGLLRKMSFTQTQIAMLMVRERTRETDAWAAVQVAMPRGSKPQ